MDLSDWRHWVFLPLLPIAIPYHMAKVSSAEKTTKHYLENVSPMSCLTDLDKALGSLLNGVDHVDQVFEKFAITSSGGKLFWRRSNFARYIDASQPGNQVLTNCAPLLWRIFSFFAHYPFSAPTIVQDKVLEVGETEIDRQAFRRAFAFLVLRGIELYGLKHNGDPYFGPFGESSENKVPRIARMIFRSLSVPSQESVTQSQNEKELLQLQDVKDTIYFTQPITFNSFSVVSGIRDEHFESAGKRLLGMNDAWSTVQGSSPDILPKADLRSLIQLFLLLRLKDRRWRDGLNLGKDWQRTGDIQYSHLVPDPEEASRASDLASAFMTSHFPGIEHSVPWDTFNKMCLDRPPFILSFFQLWASIFAPNSVNPPRSQNGSFLPVSTINLLCLEKVANYTDPHFRCRFHQDELQFHLDLQDALLVADLSTKPELDEVQLHKTITARDWFHVLLIEGEDLESQEAAEEKKTRLIAAFLTPPEYLDLSDNRMHHHEMCHDKFDSKADHDSRAEYDWRSSTVQLLPNVTIANNRGMSPHIVSRVLELRSPEAANEQTTLIKLDMRKKLVDITGLMSQPGEDSSQDIQEDEKAPEMSAPMSTWKMRLIDLKCYRMPGTSSKIIQDFSHFLVSIGKITHEQRRLQNL